LDLDAFGEEPAFDWTEPGGSAFRNDLIAGARSYFEAEKVRRGLSSLTAATKAPPHRWCEVLSFHVMFYMSAYLMTQGSWMGMLSAPFTAWLCSVSCFHDGLHFALSSDWRVNAWLPYAFPFFNSPTIWYNSHTIGHHVHTNDHHRDPDVNAAPEILRMHGKQRHEPRHRAQKYLFVLLWSLSKPLQAILKDQKTRLQGWCGWATPLVFRSRARKLLHVLGRYVVFYLSSGYFFHHWLAGTPGWTGGKAFAFAWIPNAVYSVIFIANAQINHLNEACMREDAADHDWSKHQVKTSSSFGAPPAEGQYTWYSYLCYILTGGLNLQIEHHAFPGFNHYHIYKLSPMIREVCKKHGVRYNDMGSFGGAFKAHLEYNAKMAEGPKKDA